MKKSILKLVLAASPLLILLGIYMVNDPFMVLYHYECYFAEDGVTNPGINKDFISTQAWLNNYSRYHYDSYIFGSSRSMNYLTSDWKKHITATECYHFDAYYESLYGIERKLHLLDSMDMPVKNALIIYDNTVCKYTRNREDFYNKKHPALTGENGMRYQLDAVKGFFSPKFLEHYLYCLVMRKPLYITPAHYDCITNELTFRESEKQIAADSGAYYKPRQQIFFRRDTVERFLKPAIFADQKRLFQSMLLVLIKRNTRFRIVISPMYNQRRIAIIDLRYLDSLFGKENVFDFSGINDITADRHNYYETSHYRPQVAARLMDSIYR